MLQGLTSAVDLVVDAELEELCDAAVRDEFVGLCRELDRLEHRRAQLLAVIHRRGIPDAVGAVSTPMWAQHQTGLPARDARDALNASLACESLRLTGKAWAQGEMSAHAARAICRAVPAGHEGAYLEIEETLVDFAATNDWRSLNASIAYARRCADALDDREPSDLNGLRHSKVGDRWVTNGDLDDLAGTTVDDALRSATDEPTAGDLRSPVKLRADGLVRIARFWLDHKDLPVEGGERPHVSIVETWDTIRAGLPSASGIGPSLSPADLAALLCDARIERIITDPKCRPLDIGRLAHNPTKAMRRAVTARDRCCRFPGCDRRPSWSDLHHVRAWMEGGETKVANLVLLCPYHHHLIHRRGWRTTFDGVTFTVFKPDGEILGATRNAGIARARN
ncbi:MAG TPA: DUF222 domain-containing protein [Acidimicrobiia bacterium]|nr:DUF222 domain-containing protein [Acidimicrobiia bacterium]